ncbi:hypothetical protein J7E70_00185 [Variovorax paradoxus]|nr:hypothetical protein [Variovorax paradoxus]MBT2298870.1 hypothetical protein [Variovorax paradoxus]
MPTIELRRIKRIKAESAYLRNQHASDVTSQFGEDGIISKILDLIGRTNCWCVEFGAWDGKYLSNTWNLINNEGWCGVLIEGAYDRYAALNDSYRLRAGQVFVQHGYVGWQSNDDLDSYLSSTPIPNDLDVLSIDIDGNDWHVWSALKNYRPRLVVIEFDPTASNELYFVQDADASLNQGASLRAMVELAQGKGYELAATTYTNAFFVLTEEFPKLNIADNSIDAIHESHIEIQICQGYDGTLFAAGHLMLNWHGIPLVQEDFQVIPAALRKYPDPGQKP